MQQTARRLAPLPRKPETVEAVPLELIREALQGIRFGEVRIVVQDGHVVQVDRVEKLRLS